FLKDLDFTSSNDRLFIGLLKGLGFLDESGAPTDRYFQFLDHSQARRGLADALRGAYDELFSLNKTSPKMEGDEVKGKLKSLTQGQKSDTVIGLMANTFKGLSELADWSAPAQPEKEQPPPPVEAPSPDVPPPDRIGGRQLELHYNIQLILPESRD